MTGIRQSDNGPLALAPGVLLSIAVALLALGLQRIETALFGRAWLEALVLAILSGAVIRTAWTPSARWTRGVHFSAKPVLEVAIVLLGASVSAATVMAIGPAMLAGIVGIVVLAIASSYAIGRALGLHSRLALLIACGNSICGNSAIAAVAPIIDADGEDVSSAIAFTAVLGVAVVLLLPLVAPLMGLSDVRYGVLAGLTVYAVPQVLAATAPAGAVAVQAGTLVKLVRVLMLGPVCVVLAVAASRKAQAEGGTPGRLDLGRLVPWFILGFLVMAAIRSAGWIPATWLPPIAATSSALTVVAMAALGLESDLKAVARSGVRVTAAVILSLAVLFAIAVLLIHVALPR